MNFYNLTSTIVRIVEITLREYGKGITEATLDLQTGHIAAR